MNTHDIELRSAVMGAITDAWDRAKQIDDAADEVLDLIEAAYCKQRGEPVDLDRFDPGFFGGQDGMPAYVWHDIIRAELDRAYDFYMDQIDRAAPQLAEPVKVRPETLSEHIARDMREGRFPDKSERKMVPAEPVKVPSDALDLAHEMAEQEDAAYQARRSDQGLMESEWGPMEDAPPHEDPPMHVAVVEGDDAVRTLQWNRDVAAFAYPVGTLLYAARSQAKEGA